jgi:hypothetical protein
VNTQAETVTLDGVQVIRNEFFYWWESGLQKAVVFAALAKRHLADGLLIPAAISFYYFMFHLSLVMLLMDPERSTRDVQRMLLNKLQQTPGADPTKEVRHNHVEKFLLAAQGNGLVSERFVQVFQGAQEVREFVNYAPRVQVGRDVIWQSIRHTSYQSYLRAFFGGIDAMIEEFGRWTFNWGRPTADWILIAATPEPDFLSDPQFMYVAWCPEDIIQDAQAIRSRLAEQLRHGLGTRP